VSREAEFIDGMQSWGYENLTDLLPNVRTVYSCTGWDNTEPNKPGKLGFSIVTRACWVYKRRLMLEVLCRWATGGETGVGVEVVEKVPW